MIEKPVHEEIREWQQLRCTRYLLQLIDTAIADTQEVWAGGGFTSETEFKTNQLNASAIGFIRAMEELYTTVEGMHEEAEYDNS